MFRGLVVILSFIAFGNIYAQPDDLLTRPINFIMGSLYTPPRLSKKEKTNLLKKGEVKLKDGMLIKIPLKKTP